MLKNLILILVGTAFLTSCARNISSETYAAVQVGEAAMTYTGVIKNVREVVVQHGEELGDNGLGIAGGGIAGGTIASAAGKGHWAPTAIGAVGGAIAGAFLEKKLKQQKALEYVVQLDNGDLMTVVQGLDQSFYISQPVFVIVSPYGRSRITPQN